MNYQSTGILWYSNEAEYEKFKQACEDGGTFQPFQTWVKLANAAINRPGPGGTKVVKVHADCAAFLLWCKVKAQRPNGRARMLYAAEGAQKLDFEKN